MTRILEPESWTRPWVLPDRSQRPKSEEARLMGGKTSPKGLQVFSLFSPTCSARDGFPTAKSGCLPERSLLPLQKVSTRIVSLLVGLGARGSSLDSVGTSSPDIQTTATTTTPIKATKTKRETGYFISQFCQHWGVCTNFVDSPPFNVETPCDQTNSMIGFLGPIFALITRLGFKAFCQGEKSPSEPEMVSGRLRI